MKKLLISLCSIFVSFQFGSFVSAATFSDLSGVADDLIASITELEMQGIVHGYGDGTFHPNATVSEQELARMLLRSRGEPENVSLYSGSALTRIEALRLIKTLWRLETASTAQTSFADVGSNDQHLVALFTEKDIVHGYSSLVFGPNAYLTRAEAAKVVLRSRSAFPLTSPPALTISQNVVQIVDVSPMTLQPSGSGSVLFTIKNNGDLKSGLVYRDDYIASVVSGGVRITGSSEIGNGLYQLTFIAPANAPSAPVNIRITVFMGSVYSTDINEFLANKYQAQVSEPRVSLAQLVPNVIASGNTAQIIVTPRTTNGNPVSGLEIVAEVTKGAGDIIETMAENPAGSGVYIGTYKARGASGSEIEITIRVNNLASRPQTTVRGTVR